MLASKQQTNGGHLKLGNVSEGENSIVKPLRFGELSVIATGITLHKYTLNFAPSFFLKMILIINYKSTIIKK